MGSADLYEELVEAAGDIYGVHPGNRALHAKGTWCRGTFTATPEAARLSRAAAFQGETTSAVVRFSNGSGDPESHDGRRDARGMAVKLRPEGADELDILGVTSPVFATRTPEDFLELLRLRKPDPETGQPNLEKLGAFLADHPEAQPAIQHAISTQPPASFAQLLYRSPHSFKFVNSDGEGAWGRYRWRPDAGEATLDDEEAEGLGRDYLREDLAERLAQGQVRFALLIQLAEEGDPIDDPTEAWPDERELVEAGSLEITELVDDPEGDDHIEVFDPTRVVAGIELSDDPILHARPRAYSVSAYRRAGMEVENPSEPPAAA